MSVVTVCKDASAMVHEHRKYVDGQVKELLAASGNLPKQLVQ